MEFPKAFWFVMLFLAVPAFAHHSFAMFDLNKEIVYKGTVVEWRWENPHSHIIVKVAPDTDPATMGTWDIEGQSVNIMTRQGWNRATFNAGDPILAIAHPMKDGSKGASLFFVIKNGQRLYGDIARPTEAQEQLIQKELAKYKD